MTKSLPILIAFCFLFSTTIAVDVLLTDFGDPVKEAIDTAPTNTVTIGNPLFYDIGIRLNESFPDLTIRVASGSIVPITVSYLDATDEINFSQSVTVELWISGDPTKKWLNALNSYQDAVIVVTGRSIRPTSTMSLNVLLEDSDGKTWFSPGVTTTFLAATNTNFRLEIAIESAALVLSLGKINMVILTIQGNKGLILGAPFISSTPPTGQPTASPPPDDITPIPPTPTPSTPSPTSVASPTPNPTATPVPTASPSPSPTASPTPSATASPVPSPTPSPSPVPSPTPSPTDEPTATPPTGPTGTPSPTGTPAGDNCASCGCPNCPTPLAGYVYVCAVDCATSIPVRYKRAAVAECNFLDYILTNPTSFEVGTVPGFNCICGRV
eukprot:TRINITY_DN908_c0_g1_i1.p1 TRINITY_DN908_c0_g1~~TRINITY_DN908_c0_g1_i1.p1  ORF type:complete len:383 (-),score=82.76 TRINITY_DN908_c0_g1_i1:45-1193(-)